MIVFPSILEKTPEALWSQVEKLSRYYSHFQIDIADGIFVPNKTLQIDEILQSIQSSNHPIVRQSTFEFHLMVKDYHKEIEKLQKLRNYLSIETILIHSSLSPKYSILNTKYSQFSFGLVLNPEDSVQTIKTKYNLQEIPLIQIMSVNPGAQGNPFIPESLKKIEQFRMANYRNKISLDGAVNDITIPLIISQKYLPDVLCPGSYLTKAENLEERVTYLQKLV